MIKIHCYIDKSDKKWTIKPVTQLDEGILQQYVYDKDNKVLSLSVDEIHLASKSYNEVKSVFALTRILFFINNQRYPSNNENELMYKMMLEEIAPRHSDGEPKSLSEMSKWEASQFIRTLINMIADTLKLPNPEQLTVQDIFVAWSRYNESQKQNPIDYDENGNLLDVETWRKLNCISFATGRKTDDLEIAHIISKGSRPEFRNCCWNFMLLEHELHIEVQHKISWEYLFELYPHLRARYDNAFRIAAAIDQLNEGGRLTKENAIERTLKI